jgi:polyhydroxyalkanoate synthesis repressor PhaR
VRYHAGVGPSPPPRAIRRYENRKLYDAEAGRYVTLDDVGRTVAGGAEVEVVDQKTGEDLTSFTLAQVLLERVRTGASRIPRQVLTRLIRITASPSPGWVQWPDPQDAAGRARREAERIVSRVLARGGLGLDEAVALRQDLGQMVHRLVAEAQGGVESRLRALLERGEGVAGRSLEALRGGLQAFESYIDKPAPAPREPAAGRRRTAGRPRPKRAARPAATKARGTRVTGKRRTGTTEKRKGK